MQYRVCEAKSAARLQRKVNGLIEAGWAPAGGVAVSPSPASGAWWYYQAMIKPRADDESGILEAKPLATGLGDFE